MAEITSGAMVNVEFLREEIVKVLPGVFLKDLGVHSAVTWISPSFVLSSRRSALVALAQQCWTSSWGKMFFLLNWHYPKRFFHGVCFGHTLDMGRFASVWFQRLGELGVFAGWFSDKTL